MQSTVSRLSVTCRCDTPVGHASEARVLGPRFRCHGVYINPRSALQSSLYSSLPLNQKIMTYQSYLCVLFPLKSIRSPDMSVSALFKAIVTTQHVSVSLLPGRCLRYISSAYEINVPRAHTLCSAVRSQNQSEFLLLQLLFEMLLSICHVPN